MRHDRERERAATFKILRAIGIDLMHNKQAFMIATLIEELRREQQHVYGGLREGRHVRLRSAEGLASLGWGAASQGYTCTTTVHVYVLEY